MKMKMKSKVRWITVAIACSRMKDKLGYDVSPQRMRQILTDEQNRDPGIVAEKLGVKGWWRINADSFDAWLDRQRNGSD